MMSSGHFANFSLAGNSLLLKRLERSNLAVTSKAGQQAQSLRSYSGSTNPKHSQQLRANYALFYMTFDSKLLHLTSRESLGRRLRKSEVF